MPGTVVGVTDNREEDGSILVRVNFPERMYTVTFIEDGRTTYTPVEIEPETTEGVHIEDLFNGLISTACDHLSEKFDIIAAPNKPAGNSIRGP